MILLESFFFSIAHGRKLVSAGLVETSLADVVGFYGEPTFSARRQVMFLNEDTVTVNDYSVVSGVLMGSTVMLCESADLARTLFDTLSPFVVQ